MIKTDIQRKIFINNILITVAICLICNIVTILVVVNNKSPTQSISQSQTVNVNTDKKTDLNKASKEELMSLPGIGPTLADRIINNRPYKSVWDLNDIEGIGENKIYNLEKVVTCE